MFVFVLNIYCGLSVAFELWLRTRYLFIYFIYFML